MNIQNVTIQNTLKFLGNRGSFNHQPIFILAKDAALTGGEFLSLCRVRSSSSDIAPGKLIYYVGFEDGTLQTISGNYNVYGESLTGMNAASTSDSNTYVITTIVTSGSRIDSVVKDANVLVKNVDNRNLNSSVLQYNVIGTGIRPIKDSTPTNGKKGNSQVALYLFNMKEHNSDHKIVVDRSDNNITMNLRNSASGNGSLSSVTGWTYGPIEGGFRIEKGGYIESISSNLFNVIDSSSAISVITNIKFVTTGNSDILTIGACANNELISYKSVNGNLNLFGNNISISGFEFQPGVWYNIAGVVDASSASNSGMYMYVNGDLIASSNTASISNFNDDSRILIGKSMDLTSSGLSGVIGLTRIFNRSLSTSEIFLNYLSSIPSMSIQNSLFIA